MRNEYYDHKGMPMPMQFERNDDIYYKLMQSFETKMLTQCQYDSLNCYMRNHCDILFTQDILNFLEDYNAIISQSIQAIKSLLAENSQLREMKLNEQKPIVSNDRNNYSDNPIDKDTPYCGVNDTVPVKDKLNTDNNANYNIKDNEENNEIVIKQPLRQQLKILSKGKTSSSSGNINCKANNNGNLNENNKNQLKLFNENKAQELNRKGEQNQIEYNNELDTIQKTNEILKQVPIIQQNQKRFLLNYCPGQSLKDFLSKIIEYKYEPLVLNEILKDIQRLTNKNGKEIAITPDRQFNNANTKKTHVTNHSFNGSLRCYNTNTNINTSQAKNKNQRDENANKPFVQYTSPYGRLFKNKDNNNSN